MTDRELLLDIQARLARLEAVIKPRSGVTRAQQALLLKVLPAAAGVKGSAWLTVAELFEDAAPALRIALDGVSRKSLGRALSRAQEAGEPIGAHVVERGANEAGAAVWRVMWGF